uniref:Putative 2-dehydropantoate 2-reductase (Ketopantoate reductase) (KPA reductase) (KPR) n=1 Tax=mine drainage metagenome TaxID=410659 RepID=E6PHS0_9ZZZZ
MRIVVIGAGGIGGFIAAALARSGAEVAVMARGAHADAIVRSGLQVRGDLGTYTVPLRVVSRLEDFDAFQCALLCVKAHQLPSLDAPLQRLSRAGACVVTLQNGVPFWFARRPPLASVDPGGALGSLFDDRRTIGGVVHVSGHIEAPGSIVQSGGMRYVLAPIADGGSAEDACDRLIAMMERAGLAPERSADLRGILWAKLANNVALNAVSALTRLSIAPMLAFAPTRDLVARLIGETLAVGRALGVVGAIDIEQRMAYAARLSDVRTSMLQDVLAERTMEIDPILGATVELGERVSVPTPTVTSMLALLRGLQASFVR